MRTGVRRPTWAWRSGITNHDGASDFFLTTFSNDNYSLYLNRGNLDFNDVTQTAGLGSITIPFLGWGALFLDYDNDGWLDILAANGHVYPQVDEHSRFTSFRQRTLLVRNLRNGKFVDVTGNLGPGMIRPKSSRGAAVGDLFNDGDLDIVLINVDEPPTVLRNRGGNSAGHWISLQLIGDPARRTPRDAIGSVVFCEAGGFRQKGEVASGRSYVSQSDLRVHFGLGAAERVAKLEIRWSNGESESIAIPAVNRFYTVVQGRRDSQVTKAALIGAVVGALVLLRSVAAAPPQDQLQRTTQLWTEGIIDVSGLASLTAFSNVPYDDQDLDSICAMKQIVVRNAFQATGDYLAHLESAPSAQRDHQSIMKLHHQLAQLHSYQGDMELAIERFEAAYRIAAEQKLDYFQQSLEEKLGIAQMRRGEVENCVQSHNARSCIFPLSVEALHQRPSGSEAAIKHFLKFLAKDPDNLEVRWLLNVAHMTLGSYPAKVPPADLLQPSVFQSKAEVGALNDVAPSLGLDVSNMAGGSILEDFDGDGYLDAVVSSQDSCAPLRYFHSTGDGTFEDETAKAGLADQLGGLNLIQTDYNNERPAGHLCSSRRLGSPDAELAAARQQGRDVQPM